MILLFPRDCQSSSMLSGKSLATKNKQNIIFKGKVQSFLKRTKKINSQYYIVVKMHQYAVYVIIFHSSISQTLVDTYNICMKLEVNPVLFRHEQLDIFKAKSSLGGEFMRSEYSVQEYIYASSDRNVIGSIKCYFSQYYYFRKKKSPNFS